MKVCELIEWLKRCNPESEVEVSVDVSTDTEDEARFGDRVFGRVMEVIYNTHPTASILVEMTYKNFKK